MWPYALATLRHAYRSPLTWVLGACGVFVAWFGATAAILAISEVGEQAGPLVFSTSHLAGVLLTLWLIGRGLSEDRHSGFAAAADAARPGAAGRLLGRWAGGTLAGAGLAMVVGIVTAASPSLEQPDPLYLLSTSIQSTAAVGAWAVLFGSLWRGGGATLAAFTLWVAGHLPWGQAPFLEGLGGRLLRAWLPGSRDAAVGLTGLGYTSAAVIGLLLLTVAACRPAES